MDIVTVVSCSHGKNLVYYIHKAQGVRPIPEYPDSIGPRIRICNQRLTQTNNMLKTIYITSGSALFIFMIWNT